MNILWRKLFTIISKLKIFERTFYKHNILSYTCMYIFGHVVFDYNLE